jgi:Flp pilus assembly protein TadD
MGKYFSLCIILLLSLLIPSFSSGVTVSGTGSAGSGATTADVRVVSIFLSGMDDQYVYASDGRKFELNPEVRIINNKSSKAGRRTAELFFKDGRLISVTIK